jgi:sugar lactone lactonase YvrE
LAFDSNGNLFVSDENNNKIRKISVDGRVTSWAGTDSTGHRDGPSAQAEFNSPTGIAIDNKGWLYVADSNNHCIRKITPDGKEVSTWAGSANDSGSSDGVLESARFDNPWQLILDVDGSMYVLERQGNRIRHIENKTGLFHRLPPNPTHVDLVMT